MNLDDELSILHTEVNRLSYTIEELKLEIVLLRKELDTVKVEGCWRYYEDPKHRHKNKP